jgi:hypothetical protein
MSLPGKAQEFVSRIAARCRADEPAGPVLVATGRRPDDGAVVIIYREALDASLLGRVYDLDSCSRLFDPALSVADLADIAYVDDLSDPSGRGVALRVDWARGLVPHPDDVGWIVDDDELSAVERAGLLGT